ncbi:MAG: helix-turn-helix domain-containing protein [Synergistaceae bacterium]|nr:helix-turn-helix domain-containing protein [Synergistaceae bacterium]
MLDENDISIEFEARGQSDFWFACVDIKVIRDKELSPCDKTVFAVICSHVDVQSRQWSMTVKHIAEETACDERTVQRSLKALAARGVIERFERFKEGKQKASIYRIVGHRAACYNTDHSEPDANMKGDKNNPPRGDKNAPPRGDKNDGALLEPRSYDTKDYSLSESAVETSAPPERPVEMSEVPVSMRPTVEYFLHKTGRANVDPGELVSIRILERDHFPARVQQEINTAVERFRRSGRDPTTLTFDYLGESLRYQPGRRAKTTRASPTEKKQGREQRAAAITKEKAEQSELIRMLEAGEL